MSLIDQQIQQATRDWDIEAIVKAVVADEPEMAEHQDDLRLSLMQLQNGEYKETKIEVSPIAQTRHKANLSQPKFAEKLGISVNTLRSWEQGLRKPSGAAKTLLDLLQRKPELIHELGA